MGLILNIETATTVCSVSLAKDGVLLALKEQDGDYSHAENLTLFIEDVVKEANVKFSDFDAIAVSKGPGSYTGLRIGVSTAKGLCYALSKPLIAVDTLRYLSLALSEGEGNIVDKRPRFFTTGKLDWNASIGYAKENRRYPTEAEQIIWQSVRASKLGFKFRRQHPIDKYIVDFVCIEKRLVVEIDGKIHDYRKSEDEERTLVLNEKGFKVIRFTNEQIITQLEQVLTLIQEELNNISTTLSFGEGRGEVFFCPMFDARRMEVYCAVYDSQNKVIMPTSAQIIDDNSFSELLDANQVYFFGNGSEKCKPVFASNKNALFLEGIVPSAADMISLSEKAYEEKQFENVAYFEPYYLKDFIAGKKKKGI